MAEFSLLSMGLRQVTGPEGPVTGVRCFVSWSVPRCPAGERGDRWGLSTGSQPGCTSASPGSLQNAAPGSPPPPPGDSISWVWDTAWASGLGNPGARLQIA